MKNKQRTYQDVLVTHLVLKSHDHKKVQMSLKTDKPELSSRKDQGFFMKIPYMKKILSSKKKVRYVVPKGGVPIIAGPDVISRMTAMARMKKSYIFNF